jgi:hypothetical protein
MLMRWLLALLMAIGLGVAGLELTTCVAAERRAVSSPGWFSDGGETPLPAGAEVDAGQPSALPRFTH